MKFAVSFVVVLGILIFVHELGHFLFAKLFKVKVLKFSLGFGPKVFGKQHGDTEYLISAFPLGGYVKMLGENPVDEVAEVESAGSFAKKPVWKRFVIVAGGPVFNLLFAVFVFCFIFAFAGVPKPVDTTKIAAVSPDSPAAAAGLKADDTVLAIDGLTIEHWETISERITASNGKPVTIKVRRGEEILELTGTPKSQDTKNIFGEKVGTRYMLGISRSEETVFEKVSLADAIIAGVTQTGAFIYLTVMGIVKIIQKVVPASELGGPILIAQIAGKQLEAGWLNLLNFMGLLSVNLGILNLFPIPVLDGGHLVFYTFEAIRRKPLAQKTQEIMQQVGLVLLGTLMLFIFYNDLVRIFKG